MITTLTDTTASAVDKTMTEMRETFGENTIGRVLTLIIIATGDIEEPLEAAIAASHEHPARVLVVDADPEAETSGLDAEIRVGRDAGAGEIVILHARGDVLWSLDTLVMALLLPDAPIVTWWPENAPSSPVHDVLGSMSQRRITDSAACADPLGTLKRLRRGYASGDSDFAWARLTRWRGLVASAYEVPPVSVPSSVEVLGTEGNPSVLLMASWLQHTLGVEASILPPPSDDPDFAGVHGVRLVREDGTIELTRVSDDSIVMKLPGDDSGQHVTMPRRTLAELVTEELRRLDPDEVYGEVLGAAFSGISDTATFANGKPAPQDVVVADAEAVGLGLELEIAAIRAAIVAFPLLPADASLSVNASPSLVTSGRLEEGLDPRFLDRTVVEITEHAQVDDYELLRAALDPLAEKGVKVAVDDAGAGFSGLRHIVQIAPDIIKMDMSLTRGIDEDRARRALASAMVYYGRETGATVVAEGIETLGELETLKGLGIHRGQGYLLGRPAALPHRVEPTSAAA